MSSSPNSSQTAAAKDSAAASGFPHLSLRAWGIAIGYAVLATVWIYYSDRALAAFIDDPELLIAVSVYKGVGFVVVTSLMLLVLVRWAFAAMASSYADLDQHKQEIERLVRLNSSLSHINQTIIRTSNRDELFQRICDVLVRDGGFGMAWIGWHDKESLRIQPIATAGDPAGTIDGLNIYSDDRRDGRGPSGLAFRQGSAYICNDLLKEPVGIQWSDELRRRDFRSMAAFPIRFDGETAGILSVYSAEPNFFRTKEVAIVEEAVVDLSFALDGLELERQRREAESRALSEKTFSDTIIESMPGVVYLYDAKGRFLRWNRNFEVLSGYSAAEIEHLHPLDFAVADDRAVVEAWIAAALLNGEASMEVTFSARDGRSTPFTFNGRRVQFEGLTCLVGVGIDISEQKSAEQELRELNLSLEGRVSERTAELERALIRAESADRIKSAFLATMSHELRTPLNSIIGFTGILIQKLAGPLTDEQFKQLGMVRSSARHLLALINDVLDISKIEAGQLEIRRETVDVKESIEHVLASIQPMADSKGLDLVVSLPPDLPAIISDQRRVEQILINLLNNAVKFTDRGTVEVVVSVDDGGLLSGDSTPRPLLRVSVIDTGIGIRQRDQEVLFEPFRQLDSGLSRQHEGTGLGLAICRRLSELLGGDIRVKSKLGEGSNFTLTLPLIPIA